MSNLILPYSSEDRQKARAAVKRLRELSTEARYAYERSLVLLPDSRTAIEQITKTTEGSRQIDILNVLADRIQTEHLAKLLPLAPHEFNAFCEYVQPDEPPAGKWLEWLTTTLQKIEMEPGNERFVLNCPPGHAKPLHVDTLIMMGDGSWKRLGDVQRGDYVVSHTGKKRRVTEVHEQGELEVFKLKTKKGREIITAADHSFMHPNGNFLRADALRPGDPLVISKGVPLPKNMSRVDIRTFELAAHSVAFARLAPRKTNSADTIFVTAKDEAHERLIDCLKHFEIKHSVGLVARNTKITRISIKASRSLAFVLNTVEKVHLKKIPKFVHLGGHEEVRVFLSTIMSNLAVTPARPLAYVVNLNLRSEDVANDLLRLFARFGVYPKKVVSPSGMPRLHFDRITMQEYYASGLSFTGQFADRFETKIATAGPTRQKHTPPSDSVSGLIRAGRGECRCLTVEKDHTFVANGVVVHNSTYASRLFVAWRIGRRPRDKVIGGGHSQRFVENEFSKKIRSIVMSAPYRKVFPHIAIDTTTRAKDQWELASGGSYVAKGAGQAIHGFRANFACIDDPYAKISDAESPAVRDEIQTWFFNDIGSRLLPGAQIFLVMTRFHEEDLTGACEKINLLLPERARYKIVTAPAICYDEDTDVLGRHLGEVLWPYYNVEYFENKQVEWSFQRFQLVYQQEPGATAEGSVASKLQFYTTLPHLTDEALNKAKEEGKIDPGTQRPITSPRDVFRRIVMSVDTASKKTERADYTVGQVWGETGDRRHYLIDQFREKVEFNAMIEKIESMARKWNVDSILVEDKGQGTAYIQARGLTEHQRRLAPAPIIPIQVNSGEGKTFRFDEITPIINEGAVYLPKSVPWITEVIREISQFPDGAHDDTVDAMTQYLRWAKTTRTRYGSRKVTKLG